MILTFKEIKEKCVSGETILVGEDGCERFFIGFGVENTIVTQNHDLLTSWWGQHEIKNWKIKQDDSDLYYIWNVKGGGGNYWLTPNIRMNKDGHFTDGEKSAYAKYERTICTAFPPIDKDGNEVEL